MPPRQRKRAAPTQTSKRRRTDDVSDVDSDSSLSSVPESDDEGPSSRAPRAVASDADLLEQGDNELFQAVLDGSIEEASENWIVLYQGEPAEALTQLVTFVIRLCGCTATLSSDEVRDLEHRDALQERIQSQEVRAPYPIVSRTKPWSGVRKSAARLIAKLWADASEAEVLADDDLLDTWQSWLVGLSVSSIRAFRHTASVVALWTIGALSAQLEQVRESYDVAVKQRDAEARRTSSSSISNRTRLAHTAHKMEQLDTQRDTFDAHLDDLVTQVFGPRSRDFDAAIRLDCMEQLGQWLIVYPTQYMQTFYYKHLGAALSDPDASVRACALRGVHGVLRAAHAAQLAPFVEEHKARMMDMALYDTDMHVRGTAFAVLASANEHDMLEHDDRSALAVHIYDREPRIRHAAAAFLLRLLEPPDDVERIRALVARLSEYDAQLPAEPDTMASLAVLEPGLGRISIALEALWDQDESLHAFKPYVQVLMRDDMSLSSEEESAAVEMVAAATRLVSGDEEGHAWDDASLCLVEALPLLLAKYSADAPRLADLLAVVPHMRLEVYHETRNMEAFESLWDDVCAHFMRHVHPVLLQRAARAIQLLATAPMAAHTTASRLATLKESVLSLLQDTLYQRQVDTTVFSEDDVHNLQASLARLYTLLKAMDASALLDDDEPLWQHMLALAMRGRLQYDQEKTFVHYALSSLALYLLWRTKRAIDDDTELVSRRDEVLQMIHMFLERGSHVQATVLHVALILHTLFFTVRDDLRILCPEEIQTRCATQFSTELQTLVPLYRAQGKSIALLDTDMHISMLASAYVAALRVGALGVQHAAAILTYYGHFHSDFDRMCHEAVEVMRDDAMHSDRAWAVCETILEALKGSMQLYFQYKDTEPRLVSLARQLANATMIRGPGFSVVRAIDANAMVTLHVAAVQQFVQYVRDGGHEGHEAKLFKALVHLVGTLHPSDALKIHATMQQRLAAAHVEPEQSNKAWDPYFAYEKRLLNVAAKDAHLLHTAQPS